MMEIVREVGTFTIVPDAIFYHERLDTKAKMLYVYLCYVDQTTDELVDMETMERVLQASANEVIELVDRLEKHNIVRKTENLIELISPNEWR